MKNKLLVVVAGLSAFTLAACAGGEDQQPTQTPTVVPTEPTVPAKAEFVFKGKATIKDQLQEITLSGYKDNKFVLNVGVKKIEGTYELNPGKGYLFILDDANHTEFKSVWNAEKKQHETTLSVKLGSAGTAELTLVCPDPNFQFVEDTPKDIFAQKAVFTGEMPGRGGSTPVSITFNADGEFEFAAEGEMAEYYHRVGEFVFENNQFVLTSENKQEGVSKSTFDPLTGTYSLKFKYSSGYGQPTNIDFTYKLEDKNAIKTTIDSQYGPMDCALIMNADGTALFDITTSVGGPSMQGMFDKKATWKFSADKYIFTVELSAATETEEAVTKDYEMVFNNDTKQYELLYKLPGQDGEFEFPLAGKELPMMNRFHGTENAKFGLITYDIIFLADNKVKLDITPSAGQGTMDDTFDMEGTYTFVDNKFDFTIGEIKASSTWNEETGSYNVKFGIKGQDMDLNPDLNYVIWK